ncbi:electron transfer flavoprotein subunit alpha/FixB family protein [Thermoproteota archaeon]
MSILVFSEDKEHAYQLLAKATELAQKRDTNVYCLTANNPQNYINQGAETVYTIELDVLAIEPYRAALLKAVEASGADTILIGATKLGKDIAPRIASALGVGCMTDCSSVEYVDSEIVVERLTYGGLAIAKETSTSKPTVITVPPRSFEKLEAQQKTGEIKLLTFEVPETKIKVLERREKPKGDQDLENAAIIVSAGRGFKNKEDLKILEELAEALGGAAIGCTRPISADLGWMEEWVGISGKKVKPKFYITCGISGQIQHIAGIRDSKIIVSINNDENAGIHGMSDYSIVGDIYEVLPALVEALKEKA